MPRNEEGEFELVVGNRQLMALLFVLFSVCGVVFGIGYWIGKNAAPETPSQTAASNKPSPGELPGNQAKPEAAGAPVEPAPLPQAAADVPLQPGEAKVTSATETTPVGGAKPQPPAEEKPQPAPEVKPTPPPKPPPAKPVETAKTAPALPPSAGPRAGERYLQIAAVKRAEAEIVADAIKKRGFHAITAPATPGQPADGLWRVLVGPVGDAASLAKARADLQAAGFKQVFVQKY
jgi:cell division septation protein DedD